MPMSYEDQVGIGANINAAASKVYRELRLEEKDVDKEEFISALAEAVLTQIDQAGYMIVKKR